MSDQADVLRNKMLLHYQPTEKIENQIQSQVISVLSGKGGVGKSNFVINFGFALQELGKKVLIFDLDIGMANVDILLGRSTTFSVVDMIENKLPIRDIIYQGPNQLAFVSGGSGLSNLFAIDQYKLGYFLDQLASLNSEYDYILFDMPAGISETSIRFVLSSNEIILVTTPEPTSITDAYAAIKYVHLQDTEVPISMVVNRIRKKEEGYLTNKNLSGVSERFLNRKIELIGAIPDDDAVWKAVLSQKPFFLMSRKSKPSVAISEIAERFLSKYGAMQEEQTSIHSFIGKFRRFFLH